mmetsp:Transcript_6370/g.16481  ORF Transcript_6370/g.16481 Transcript_6370/m.16481 type:complete len:268 (-) Transcript_6370:587-1390(-)
MSAKALPTWLPASKPSPPNNSLPIDAHSRPRSVTHALASVASGPDASPCSNRRVRRHAYNAIALQLARISISLCCTTCEAARGTPNCIRSLTCLKHTSYNPCARPTGCHVTITRLCARTPAASAKLFTPGSLASSFTVAPSRKISPFCIARRPTLPRMVFTETPAVLPGSTAKASVFPVSACLAHIMMTDATGAFPIQRLRPSSCHNPPPSGVASVRSPDASLPASASVRAQLPTVRCAQSCVRYFFFCASLPSLTMVFVTRQPAIM